MTVIQIVSMNAKLSLTIEQFQIKISKISKQLPEKQSSLSAKNLDKTTH